MSGARRTAGPWSVSRWLPARWRAASGRTRAERVRTSSAVVAGVTVPGVLAVLAVVHPGVTISEVELNDGAVWVTDDSALALGRFDARLKELNGGLVASSSTFDVLQDAQDVLLVEPGRLSVVDPATVALATQADVPAQTRVSMAAGVVALTSPQGLVWVRTTTTLSSITADTPGEIDLADGALAAVGPDGTVLALDPADGSVHRGDVSAGGGVSWSDAGTLTGAAGVVPDEVTVVGDVLVARAGSTLYGDGWTTDVSADGGSPALQATSGGRGTVAVATTTHLIEVDLADGTVEALPSGGTGRPARPVALGGCVYGAWASVTGSYLQRCGTDEPVHEDLERMTTESTPVFRVNRSVVALNDTLQGNLWMLDELPKVQVPHWEQIQQADDPTDAEDESDVVETHQQQLTQCTDQSPPPTAVDDAFGVRPGRTTVLGVLDNDAAGDCGVIAISDLDLSGVPAEFGEVQTVYGGRALQVSVTPQATGSVELTYTMTDGRGNNPPSTARVTLTVHDPSVNEEPVQVRVGSVAVEQGASVDYDVLADFLDPDGDDLLLVGASTTGAGTVRTRQDGVLTFAAGDDALGRQDVQVLVSDGTSTVTGSMVVDVRPAGSLAPTIDPVHVRTYAGVPVDVDVLASVRSASREPARLAGVEQQPGTTVKTHLEDGTFTFTAENAATYYVPFTVVASPQQVQGFARVDVLERSPEPTPPVAVRDVALLPYGGQVTIDPLANDVDPDGGILVLTSTTVADGSALQAVAVDHRYVQIGSRQIVDAPEVVEYTISNGTAEATGEILVLPVPPSPEQHAPVVQDVEVSVRTGGVVTIPVLDYASDADGDPMELVPDLPQPLGPDEGLLFASGNKLRYQAPETARTVTTVFSVRDPSQNIGSGTLRITVHESSSETKPPPRPKDLTARTFDGETVRVPIPLTGIDRDGDGVVLLGEGDTPPRLGRITAVGADFVEYEAYAGSSGTDTFTYAVEDWTGQRAQGTVRVGIAPRTPTPQPIVARDDEVTVRPGQRVEVRVLRNDVDPSGGELTLDPALEVPEGVVASVNKRRIVVETPDHVVEPITIVYRVSNALGATASAVLTVRVVDDAPFSPPVADDVVVAPIDVVDKTTVEVDVLDLAENPSGPVSDLAVSVPSSHAAVAQVTSTGSVLVTLAERAQTIPYLLTNTRPEARGVKAYAFITVPALGDFPPALRPKARELRVASGDVLTIPLAEFVQVGTGKVATISDATQVSATKADGGELVVDSTTLRFVSAPGYAGPASITFEVTDASSRDAADGRRSRLTLPITVYTEDDVPPVFAASRLDVPQGETATVDLLTFTRGPEGASSAQKYTYRLNGAASNGFTATIEPGSSRLVVSVPPGTPRGTLGSVTLTIGYGRSGTMEERMDFRTVASSRVLASVLDHTVEGTAGKDVSVNVLAGASNPFSEPLTVVSASPLVAGTATATVSGSTVTVRPAQGYVGSLVVRYRVRDVTGEPQREVDGTVTVQVKDVPAAPGAPRVGDVASQAVPLSWDAPAANGSPITGYRVTRYPGGTTTQCASTACVVSGLTNGTEYTFTVAAQNAVGWSPESPVSSRATPDAVPGAPAAPSVTSGDRQVTATWTAPANEGTPITRYTVELSDGTRTSVSGTSATFTGLANGTGYTVRVRPHNSATPAEGGAWSAASAVVVPAGLPGAPTVSAARVETPLGRQIDVTWTEPDSNGAPVLRYTVVGTAAGQTTLTREVGSDRLGAQFGQVVNGAEYTFSVTAHNAVGAGQAGVSGPTSTWTAPGAPGAGTTTQTVKRPFNDGQVTLTWTPPSDAGGLGVGIDHYQVEGVEGPVTGTSYSVGGLAGGQSSPTYRVRAVNTRGVAGPWTSLGSVPVTTRPGQPTVTAAPTQGFSELVVSWSVPGDGGAALEGFEYQVGDGAWTAVGAGVTSHTVTDVPDAGVTVQVRARNLHGSGAAGSASAVPRVPGPPAAPGAFTLGTSGPTTVTATWAAAVPNGAAVTGYKYRVYIDGSTAPAYVAVTADEVAALALARTVPGDGTYRVDLVATSARGDSPKASGTVTVQAPDDPGDG